MQAKLKNYYFAVLTTFHKPHPIPPHPGRIAVVGLIFVNYHFALNGQMGRDRDYAAIRLPVIRL